jgi:hypothetical protein
LLLVLLGNISNPHENILFKLVLLLEDLGTGCLDHAFPHLCFTNASLNFRARIDNLRGDCFQFSEELIQQETAKILLASIDVGVLNLLLLLVLVLLVYQSNQEIYHHDLHKELVDHPKEPQDSDEGSCECWNIGNELVPQLILRQSYVTY